MINARSRIAPKTDPITMPAIAPADRAACDWDTCAVEFDVAVEDGKMLPIDVVNGKCTFWQRDSVPEYKQQESVEFGELAAQ